MPLPTTTPHHNVLPNLDALRFLAFLVVLLAHTFSTIELTEPDLSLRSFYGFMENGVVGVNFFFVLSGFLITRILLNDFAVHEQFRVSRFYIRRTLRIWPVYFIILVLTQAYYILLHIQPVNTHWLYYILFIGNYHVIIHGFPDYSSLGHLWSIAVEEQFYLVWPWLIWIFRKNAKALCVVIIAGSLVFRYTAVYFLQSKHHVYFNSLSVMNDIAMGALLACLTHNLNPNSVTMKNWHKVLLFVVLLAIAVVFQGFELSEPLAPWNRVALSLFFVFVVFHQVFIANRSFNVEAVPGMSYLGKISYGLYMYHAFTIFATRWLFKKLDISLYGINGLTIYPLVALAVTIIVAVLSYEIIEKNILRLKSVWAK